MTVRIKSSSREDLREGYFFSIASDYGDAYWDPLYDPPRSKDATYYDAEEGWMYCTGPTGTKCEAIKPCSRNPEHDVPKKIVAAKWIEAHGGEPFPFIPSFELLFINEDLANRLKASPFNRRRSTSSWETLVSLPRRRISSSLCVKRSILRALDR